MLKTGLLQPDILRALAAAGHGSTVLISDGNFPHATATSPRATRVYLNLAPGKVTVSEVLDAVLPAIPVERAAFMDADDGSRPRAHDELRAILPVGLPIDLVPRAGFYAACGSDSLALVIATGDQRFFANVLFTIGAIPPD